MTPVITKFWERKLVSTDWNKSNSLCLDQPNFIFDFPVIILQFREQGGDAYFESVCAGPSLAIMSFHAPMFRGLYGKLGMPCIVGQPNMAKTKEIKSAMHMASSHKYLFAHKVSISTK